MADDSIAGLFSGALSDDPLDVEQALARFRRDVLGESVAAVELLRYRLQRVLGSGGAGVVYEAFDPELERAVAIKLVHPRCDGAREQQRLVREAKALARLSHPNVVQIHDVGRYGERGVFIVMELVAGRTLAQHIAERRDDWRALLELSIAAGRGLEAAHTIGLVHRDFKPGNVVVGDDGRVRVLDFGLAREQAFDTDTSQHELDSGDLTRTGLVMGTPAYMAPEQHRGEECDARTDQFAFAATVFEALYGQRPFAGTTIAELGANKHDRIITPPRSPVPAYVRRALLRALSPRPDDRFPSMTALIAALQRRSHGVRWLAVAGVATLVAVASFGGLREALACNDIDAELVGIWDESDRASIGDAALATRIDAWVAQWVDARTQACEHARDGVPGLDPRAMSSCFDRSRSALAAAVDLLQRDHDARLATQAIDMLDGLPSPAACGDPEGLRREPLAPEPGPMRDEVDALRRQLAELDVLRLAGRHPEAWRALEDLRIDAAALAYEPLLAEVDLAEGLLLVGEGRKLVDAEALLERAYLRATKLDHGTVAADAAIELAFVVGFRLERYPEGVQWAKLAEATLDASDLERRVRLESNRALMLGNDRVRDYEGAIATLDAALADVRAHGPERSKILATVLHNRGVMLMRAERVEEAARVIGETLAVKIEHYGPRHPKVARTHLIHGALLDELGDDARAEQTYRDALAALEGFTDNSGLARQIERNLAMLLVDGQRWEEARGLLDAWLDGADPRPQSDDDRESLVVVLCMRSAVARHDRDAARVQQDLERAQVLAEGSDAALGVVAFHRGEAERERGELAAARREYEDAVTRLDQARAHRSVADKARAQLRLL